MVANLLSPPSEGPGRLGLQDKATQMGTEAVREASRWGRQGLVFLVLGCLISAVPSTLASSETTDLPTSEFTTMATCPNPEMTAEEAQIRLWEAVERDDGPGVEAAVLCGADTGERRGDDMTPMTQAARGGAEAAVGALVRLGADLERPEGKLGRTPLHYAAKHGREAVVQELLAAGASAGPTSKARSTPLHLAAWYGHLDVARLLVGAGAEVNVRTTEGHTPLALAVMRGQPELEAYLRSVGGQE